MRRYVVSLILSFSVLAGCETPPPPSSSFYEERIEPVVAVGCVQQTTGCHLANDTGSAVGNLDLSSFDALMRRQDVLPAYGPYPVGTLLLKGGPNLPISVDTLDPDPVTGEMFTRITTDVRHNAGSLIAQESAGYAELKRWIAAGASRTGLPSDELASGDGDCVSGAGTAPGFDPSAVPSPAGSYTRFVNDVQPMLKETCASGNCHGNPVADLYLSCGDNEEESRWNYFVSVAHLTDPVSTSGLLKRPLSSLRGGVFHEGGNVLPSTEDERYQVMFDWAEELATNDPSAIQERPEDEGLRFFANRVQPMLVKKGCMFLGCHSPSMFNDLRLRGGSQGVFSLLATERNYEMSKAMLSIESENPNDSRIIAKNLYAPSDLTGGQGILHRGGSLFEDFGVMGSASTEDCAGIDVEGGNLDEVPAYCVLAKWHEKERELATVRGELSATPVESVVWVSRPPETFDVRDFDTFRGGADLRIADATSAADGAISIEASRSLLDTCGFSGNVDVRTPAVSWDGVEIAFAARASASVPFRLYRVSPVGTGCAPISETASDGNESGGILMHDFDPTYAPDGRLVFASTRGNVDGDVSYRGPTRTPAAMQPNANLFILEGAEVRQLTFLLNQELTPSMMADGRVIFTAEKREPGFHQLALRRINLDGSDYHPVFAQRPSVGFSSATEVVELANRDIAFIASNIESGQSAGALVVVNRSIGPDQVDRDPADRAYFHSMQVPVPGAMGAPAGIPAGGTQAGVFRSPASLPSGRLLVSCDLSAMDVAGSHAFELCEVNTRTGAIRSIGGEAAMANVSAVAIYRRTPGEIATARRDEPNGSTSLIGSTQSATVHVQDYPLLDTLLFANTREGRGIDPNVQGLRAFEALPPAAGVNSFASAPADKVVTDDFGSVYVDYVELGSSGLQVDGSVRFEVPGGAPILLASTDADANILSFDEGFSLSGDRIQREQMQYYPGEQLNQSFPRRFFNGMCGGCHGSISNRELDLGVNVDVLTMASKTIAKDLPPESFLR